MKKINPTLAGLLKSFGILAVLIALAYLLASCDYIENNYYGYEFNQVDTTSTLSPKTTMAQTRYIKFDFSDAGKSLSWTGGKDVQYSFDNKTWADATSPITVTGKTVLLRAKNGSTPMYGFTTDATDGGVSVSGHLGSLIDYEAEDLDYVTVSDYQFSNVTGTAPSVTVVSLFSGCPIFKYERLNFPKTNTVGKWCYANMFQDKLVYGTTSIILCGFIDLPAINIAEGCYRSMFDGCTACLAPLVSHLPATDLKPYCYYRMFGTNNHLANLPKVDAQWLAPYCCAQMFWGCSVLTKTGDFEIPALFAGAYTDTDGTVRPAADHCFEQMFYGCSALTTISSMTMLQLKTLAPYCCAQMFYDCVNLNKGAENVTGSMCVEYLPEGCFNRMYYNCPKMTKGIIYATSMYSCDGSAGVIAQSEKGPLAYMFMGCAGLTDLYINLKDGIRDENASLDSNASTYHMVVTLYPAPLYIKNVSVRSAAKDVWDAIATGDTPTRTAINLSYID